VALTAILDTQLLITFWFPPNEDTRQKAARLLQRELGRHLLIPSIVLTEYIKIAGRRIGLDAATNQLNILENRGAEITEIDKVIAIEAGTLLSKHPDTPIADALLAATYIHHSAEYILTRDDHFEELGCKTRWI
jgi:predicted nucleic acid-binding protein